MSRISERLALLELRSTSPDRWDQILRDAGITIEQQRQVLQEGIISLEGKDDPESIEALGRLRVALENSLEVSE